MKHNGPDLTRSGFLVMILTLSVIVTATVLMYFLFVSCEERAENRSVSIPVKNPVDAGGIPEDEISGAVNSELCEPGAIQSPEK